MNVTFGQSGEVTIAKGGNKIAFGKSMNCLICIYFILTNEACNQANVNKNTSLNSYKIWHGRFGHIGKSTFLEIKRNDLFNENNNFKTINPTDEVCEACTYAKQARLPFSKERDRSHILRPLLAIHSDVCGPITPTTIDEKRYYVTFIDEFTHYTSVYLIFCKNEVFVVFQDYVAKIETHYNLKIAHLYCDNGTEYLSNEYKAFCVKKGIQYHLTNPHTSQQNSISERMNRTIVEKSRAMIFNANLEKEFWGEAVLTAVYLINLIPTTSIPKNVTPYELRRNKKPKIQYLRTFGCIAYVLDKNKKSKFEKRSSKGNFVGYEPNGYKIFNLESGKFIRSRDVVFDKLDFKNSKQNKINNEGCKNSDINRQKTDKISEVSKSQEKKIDKSIPKKMKLIKSLSMT